MEIQFVVGKEIRHRVYLNTTRSELLNEFETQNSISVNIGKFKIPLLNKEKKSDDISVESEVILINKIRSLLILIPSRTLLMIWRIDIASKMKTTMKIRSQHEEAKLVKLIHIFLNFLETKNTKRA